MVGECNVWFVTADGGESWTSTNLTGVSASNYNGTGINYLAMDRFANMIAVGRKGLIYTITRQVAGDSDLATFVWTKRVAPGVSGSEDMHAASGYNASFFTVAGGPSGYLAVSHSLPGDITLKDCMGGRARSSGSFMRSAQADKAGSVQESIEMPCTCPKEVFAYRVLVPVLRAQLSVLQLKSV